MEIQSIKLANFKNYTRMEVDFHPRLNLILGQNGIGKTNLLDALYYLAFGKSYYSITDRKLIRLDAEKPVEDFFRIEGRSSGSDQYSVTYSPSRGKVVSKNQVPYERISDHIGEIPLVSIFPEDIYVIRHGSALRRKFVDGTVGQLEKSYLASLIRYNHILRQKNELLRDRRMSLRDKELLLDKYDMDLVPLITNIEAGRAAFVREFDPLFAAYYQKIAQKESENATVRYARSFHTAEVARELRNCRGQDIEKGRATMGPHRDDFKIMLNGQVARNFASQGQQKSILFSLKLAQYAYIQSALHRWPLLLLDDFFEKLDHRRIDHVMSILAGEHPGQIFVTDTDKDRMIKMATEAGMDYRIIHIE